MPDTSYNDLRAVFINCSITAKKADSHTQRLLDRVAGVMEAEGANVEQIYALDEAIAFGMVEDACKML